MRPLAPFISLSMVADLALRPAANLRLPIVAAPMLGTAVNAVIVTKFPGSRDGRAAVAGLPHTDAVPLTPEPLWLTLDV